MGEINSYRDLMIWQKSMRLVTHIYKATDSFPSVEQFGLTSQIRRCSISIPSNIAEGYSRNTKGYVYFLRISCGSLYELQTQLEIALNLSFLTEDTFQKLYDQSSEIERMVGSLINKLGGKGLG